MNPHIIAPLLVLLFSLAALGQGSYFPPAGSWEHRTPEQAKFDAVKLKEAVEFAVASEARSPRSQQLGQTQTFGREPFGEAIGLFKDRGDATGIIVRNGYVVAEWGEPH